MLNSKIPDGPLAEKWTTYKSKVFLVQEKKIVKKKMVVGNKKRGFRI